jgi:hypothetical protein
VKEIYTQNQLDSTILTYFRTGWAQDDVYHIIRDYYYVYDFLKFTRDYVRQAFKILKQDPVESKIRQANIDYIRKRKIKKKSRIVGLEVRLGIRPTTDPDFSRIRESYLREEEEGRNANEYTGY